MWSVRGNALREQIAHILGQNGMVEGRVGDLRAEIACINEKLGPLGLQLEELKAVEPKDAECKDGLLDFERRMKSIEIEWQDCYDKFSRLQKRRDKTLAVDRERETGEPVGPGGLSETRLDEIFAAPPGGESAEPSAADRDEQRRNLTAHINKAG